MIGALSAGLGLASSLYGAYKGAQANKAFENQINEQETQADAFYNNRVNRDFMETNAAKGIVEQLRKRYLDQAKQVDSQTAATGGTAEANIAAKGNLNENYNQVMSNVAEQATNYQDAAEDRYQNQVSELAKQRMMIEDRKAQNAANLMQGGAALLGTAADIEALKEPNVAAPTPGGSTVGLKPETRAAANNIAKSAKIPASMGLRTPLATRQKEVMSDFMSALDYEDYAKRNM